jgi:hypothetical protein
MMKAELKHRKYTIEKARLVGQGVANLRAWDSRPVKSLWKRNEFGKAVTDSSPLQKDHCARCRTEHPKPAAKAWRDQEFFLEIQLWRLTQMKTYKQQACPSCSRISSVYHKGAKLCEQLCQSMRWFAAFSSCPPLHGSEIEICGLSWRRVWSFTHRRIHGLMGIW